LDIITVSSTHNGLEVISVSFFNWQDKVRNPALLNIFEKEVWNPRPYWSCQGVPLW